MQIVELKFHSNQVLFCPATGQQVLIPDEPFEESPAMLFCYLPEYKEFEYLIPEMEKEYKICGNNFTVFVNRLLNNIDNYVMFKIIYPNGFESLISFDMDFQEK